MAWVVRAGEAKASDLISGYALHRLVPGLYGFSVQYEPGQSVEQLALAGQFPNATISVAEEEALRAVVAGFRLRIGLIKSPGKGYHHTFCVLYDDSDTPLKQLDDALAQALSAAFSRQKNPYRVLRRQP